MILYDKYFSMQVIKKYVHLQTNIYRVYKIRHFFVFNINQYLYSCLKKCMCKIRKKREFILILHNYRQVVRQGSMTVLGQRLKIISARKPVLGFIASPGKKFVLGFISSPGMKFVLAYIASPGKKHVLVYIHCFSG